MRRMDLTFTALLLPLDAIALLLAAITTYGLRFSKAFIEARPLLTNIPFSKYLATSLTFVFLWLILFALAGLYQRRPHRAWGELGRVIVACSSGIMLVIAVVFFRREFATSRFLVLGVWGFSVLYVWFGRMFLRLIRRGLLRARFGHQRLIIIGRNKTAENLAAVLRQEPIYGFMVVKIFKTWNDAARKELDRLCAEQRVDGIVLADPDLPKPLALNAIAFAEDHHLVFRYLADLFAARFTNVEAATLGGVPMIEVKRTPLDGWGRIAKRAFDVVFAAIILLLVSPIILFCAIFIALQDGFPIIFKNERVGERGEFFFAYKLRSMWKKDSIGPQFAEDEEARFAREKKLIRERNIKTGPVYKIADDPRVTPFGRFLRRWSLDELPQFWNVLRGDMSIVGPRPHQPREVEKYEPHHRRVLAIKPGITGLAQVSGRSDLDFEDEIRLDMHYIERWSLALDLSILLKTPFVILQRKGAY